MSVNGVSLAKRRLLATLIRWKGVLQTSERCLTRSNVIRPNQHDDTNSPLYLSVPLDDIPNSAGEAIEVDDTTLAAYVLYKVTGYYHYKSDGDSLLSDFQEDFNGFTVDTFVKVPKPVLKSVRIFLQTRRLFVKQALGFQIAQALTNILTDTITWTDKEQGTDRIHPYTDFLKP